MLITATKEWTIHQHISYKADNSEEQDGFLSISRKSERIQSDTMHPLVVCTAVPPNIDLATNTYIKHTMDIPSRGWEERSWIVIGGPWC